MIKIEIQVDSAGNFTYFPALQRVSGSGSSPDKVSWHCPSGPFAIMFKSTSPFEEGMEASADKGQDSSPLTVSTHAKGQFSYAVAVFNGTHVFMDINCPVLVAN